jgi:hypothetical protein
VYEPGPVPLKVIIEHIIHAVPVRPVQSIVKYPVASLNIEKIERVTRSRQIALEEDHKSDDSSVRSIIQFSGVTTLSLSAGQEQSAAIMRDGQYYRVRTHQYDLYVEWAPERRPYCIGITRT